MRDRYTIVVGLLFAAVVVVAFVSRIGSDGDGTLGLDQRPPRWPLPEFAVPAATSDLEGDANVAQDDCATSEVPCPEEARRTPACGVEDPRALRVCDLFSRPSVISFWFSGCVSQQDAVDEVFGRYRGRVRFLSLNVRDDRDTVRDLVADHDWGMPVGYDRDGAVASLYRVGGCPTIAYVYPGGTLQGASIGVLSSERLGERVGALLRATRNAERG